jgi:DNA modification methylase
MEIKIKSKGNRLIDWQDLKPFQGNLKKADKEDIEKLKVIIKRRGWTVPIAVWEDNILDGHGRLEALKSLINEGCTVGKIPVIDIEAKDKKEASEILLEINSRANKMTDEGLYEFIQEFGIQEYDFDNLNFPDIDIDKFMDGMVDDEIVEDEVPEVPVEAQSKLGDIYELGDHKVMCGDSTSKEDVDRLMDGTYPDLIHTDPPYGMNAVSKSGVLSENYKNDILGDDNPDIAKKAFELIFNLYPKSKQIWWGANYYCSVLPDSECWLVWDKNNGQSDQTDCELAWANFRSVVRQFTQSSEKTNRVHPTQKPVSLMAWIIKRFNLTSKTIADYFGGSGSTLIAAEQKNIKSFIMEYDPKYCDVIVQRYVDFTGNNKIKLNGKEIEWQSITPKS